MAFAFSRFEQLDGGPAVAAAMRAHPHLIRGPGAPDTTLMRARRGWIAKGGAEGIVCAAGPDGLGIALKVEDGAGRAVGPALAAFLAEVEQPLEQLAVSGSRTRAARPSARSSPSAEPVVGGSWEGAADL